MSDGVAEPARIVRSPRAAVRDLGTVVLVGDASGAPSVAHIAGPARLVWDALATPTTVDALAELVRETGVPDPPARVAEVLAVLDGVGAVDRT